MNDLNQIAAFVEVVRHGSFVAAARALDVPRSTIGARVQELEAALGMRLLKRTTRRMSLTPEGRDYHDQVAAAIATLRTSGVSAPQTGALGGTVRLTAPVEYPLDLIARAAAVMRERHPRVSIDIVLTNRRLDFVESGIDLAIRGGRSSGSGMVSVRLRDVPFGLFASPSYVARRGRPHKLQELRDHDMLLYTTSEQRRLFGLPPAIENAARRALAPIAADNMAALRELAIAGLGIAVLPRELVSAFVASGSLVHLIPGFDGGPTFRRVHLVFLSKRDVAPHVRAFADQIKAFAGY